MNKKVIIKFGNETLELVLDHDNLSKIKNLFSFINRVNLSKLKKFSV